MEESGTAAEWLSRAEKDLRIAKHTLAEFPEDSAFHSQQAAEKALKAVLVKKTGGVIKTHELVFLARKAGAPAEVISHCETLSQFFIASRYPGYGGIGGQQAAKTISAAERVVEWSKERI